MNITEQLKSLDISYLRQRNKLFKQMTKDWKYCVHQGCDECLYNDGLVPKGHKFASKFGLKD